MRFSEAVWIALNQLTVNKMRFFLTLLGIIIGIMAVIALMSIGSGATAMISGEFETIGTNMIFVQFDYRKEDAAPQNLLEKDVKALRMGSDLTTALTPFAQASSQVKAGRETQFITISGVGEDFLRVQGAKLAKGRFFNALEVGAAKYVCVLGWDLYGKLFVQNDGLGKTVRIQGKKFMVIGVMEKKDQQTMVRDGITDNMRLYMPISTLKRIWNVKGYPLVMAQPIDLELTKAAVSQFRGILARLYGPKNNFLVSSMEEILKDSLERMQIITWFLVGLGGISLLVGGIGIMNIMLVSVKERTQEIGIRKALGAKKKEILWQFLTEAVILCLLGGCIGIVCGCLLAVGIKATNVIPAKISGSSIVLAVSFSMAIGLFFGIYPAYKAAGLDPIESLRYE
ncbi:MAG: ABC transporter permease [Firmicutes bacterium]|nr:ABC transporter permease [Bacillota bacterium]